ncbi:MAG: glutaredoxin family protein [Planctomycetes bacterium]|nr:glutaredoxin family protein [Planctomycetota bacterium]
MDYIEAHREKLAESHLKVYMSRWCSDCRHVMEFLGQADIPFDKVDISEDNDAADRLFANIGKHATPYLEINDKVFVRGYHAEEPGLFSGEVFIEEVVSAMSME